MALFDQESWGNDTKTETLIDSLFGKAVFVEKKKKKKNIKSNKAKTEYSHFPQDFAQKKGRKRSMKDNIGDSSIKEEKLSKKHKKCEAHSPNRTTKSTLSSKEDEEKNNYSVSPKKETKNATISSTTNNGDTTCTKKKKRKRCSKKNKYKHLALSQQQTTQADGKRENSTGDDNTLITPCTSDILGSIASISDGTDDTSVAQGSHTSNVDLTKSTKASISVVTESRSDKKKLRKSTGKKNKLRKNAGYDEEDITCITKDKTINNKSANGKAKPKTIRQQMQVPQIKKNASHDENKSLVEDKPFVVNNKMFNNKCPADKPEPMTLLQKMQQRLTSAHFRYLNEQLYTQSGKEALNLFTEDREAFNIYHEGFQSQVAKWPVNPVNMAIEYIKQRGRQLVVVDFGCGDAKVARNVQNKVYSYDLVAVNKHVQVCDIANVPLANSKVDIGIFCLSLMGTNLKDYLAEANRVIKTGGTLLVAEVVSRFQKIGAFVRKMRKIGFTLQNKDDSSKMFIWFEFEKTGTLHRENMPDFNLSPCLYKKR